MAQLRNVLPRDMKIHCAAREAYADPFTLISSLALPTINDLFSTKAIKMTKLLEKNFNAREEMFIYFFYFQTMLIKNINNT